MRNHPHHLVLTAVLLVLLGLLPMACAEDPRSAEQAGETEAGTVGVADATESVPSVAPDIEEHNREALGNNDVGENDPLGETGAVGPVEVRLTEYAIQMPQEIPAGTTAFVIHNQGTVQHNFEIEGQGIEEKLPVPLAPGATGSLQVTLPRGEYKVYCPVADHESEGMTARLIVS